MEHVDKSLLSEKQWVLDIYNNPDWMELLNKSVDTHQIYLEPTYAPKSGYISNVTLMDASSWEAACRVKREHPDAQIIVHNFADRRYPGGYFLRRNGGAQEEHLLMESGLGVCLFAIRSKYPELYDGVATQTTRMLNASFAPVLYNTDVPMKRDLHTMDNFFTVDFVSAAMMNISRSGMEGNYYAQLHDRVATVFSSVLNNARGKEVYFITGAWGCGVFKNDPHEVFNEYATYINQNKNANGIGVNVVMAIPAGRNYIVARDVLM